MGGVFWLGDERWERFRRRITPRGTTHGFGEGRPPAFRGRIGLAGAASGRGRRGRGSAPSGPGHVIHESPGLLRRDVTDHGQLHRTHVLERVGDLLFGLSGFFIKLGE